MASGNMLIGVVTTVQPRRRQVKGTEVIRPSLHFCRIAQYAYQLGASMVMFDPMDVRWGQRTVHGWGPQQNHLPFGPWIRKATLLPNAFYENVFVHLAVAGHSRQLRGRARERGIPLFNPPLPNKWQMSQWMSRTALDRYLPPTMRLTSKEVSQAIRRVDEWGVAYVKPIGGYGGMGVMRVEKRSKDIYRVSVDRQTNGQGKTRKVIRTQELSQLFRRRCKTPHIVQRGINLLSVDGRKVDFRVVVQRGRDGSWNLIGIVPKVAAADGVVTNIIAGGERMSIIQLEALASREGVKVPVLDLTQCAMDVAEGITKISPHCGILGFDLGVDENGKTWVIEVNPKPARSLLTDDMRRAMAKHAAGFAVYLAHR